MLIPNPNSNFQFPNPNSFVSNKGVYKWSAIDRVLNSAMTFTGNVVLARLLDPSDFGLVAMVAIFTAIAQNLSSCGMSDGLIHKHNPTDRDYSTVFVFNAAFGLFFCLLFIALGMPLAKFFARPQISSIMSVLGVCFLFQTLCFVQETRMRKNLDMKHMAIVHLLSTASAVTLGIIVAINGGEYWALVISQSGLSIFTFIYFMLISRWIPRIAFYKKSFHELFGYGVHLMIAFITNMISRNINSSVIGKYVTPVAAGLYSQAQKLQDVPFAIIESVFNWAFFAVLSNEQDKNARLNLVSEMNVRLWTINITISLLLLLISWPAFNLLYGAKWDGAIPIFQLLLVFGLATAMKSFYQTVFKAYGKVKIVKNLTFIETAIQLILLVIFLNSGVIMITMTLIIAVVFILLCHVIYYCKLLDIRPIVVIKAFWDALIVPLIAFGISWGIRYKFLSASTPFLQCLLLIIIFSIIFLISCWLIKPPYYQIVNQLIYSKFRLINASNK